MTMCNIQGICQLHKMRPTVTGGRLTRVAKIACFTVVIGIKSAATENFLWFISRRCQYETNIAQKKGTICE